MRNSACWLRRPNGEGLEKPRAVFGPPRTNASVRTLANAPPTNEVGSDPFDTRAFAWTPCTCQHGIFVVKTAHSWQTNVRAYGRMNMIWCVCRRYVFI